MTLFKAVSAYIILSLFVMAAITLLGIIIHLLYIMNKKDEKRSSTKPLKLFMAISLTGIISFELTCILVIAVILEILLIDLHDLHEDIDWIDHIYYESFDEMEYLIAIFDTIGHLCVILVFVARFEYTFRAGTMFSYSPWLIRILHIICIILFGTSIAIISLIIMHHKTYTIIISEIIWEMLVEMLCLYMLYLFTSKLYHILRLSLAVHIKNGKESDFYQELTKTIKDTITSSKEKSKSGGSHSQSSKHKKKNKKKNKNVPKTKNSSNQQKSRKSEFLTMTIDGMTVEPLPGSMLTINQNDSEDVSPNPSPNVSGKNSPNLTPNASQRNSPNLQPMRVSSDDEMVIEPVPIFKLNTINITSKQSPIPHGSLDNIHEDEQKDAIMSMHDVDDIDPVLPEDKELEFQSECKSQWKSQKEIELTMTTKKQKECCSAHSTTEHSTMSEGVNGAVDLVGVMNKMTLLVLLAVITSILSVIGNVFIELHELKTIAKHDIDIQSIWSEILPLFDIVATSFMLYFSFSFTDNVYRVILGRLDTLFLKGCLKILKLFWLKQIKNDDINEKTMSTSFIYDGKMQEKKKNAETVN